MLVASGAGAVPAHQSSAGCRGGSTAAPLAISNNESRQKVQKSVKLTLCKGHIGTLALSINYIDQIEALD